MHLRYIAIAVLAVIVIAIIVVVLMRRRSGGRQTLPAGAAERYLASWEAIQTRFVDQPQQAVAEADRLAVEVMQATGGGRGAQQRLDRARQAAGATGDHQAMTEGLRQAMLEYRGLMDEALGHRAVNGTRREVAS